METQPAGSLQARAASPPTHGPLFHREDNRPRDRVGYAEPATQILKCLAEAVERGDHRRASGGQRLRALPFRDDAVASLAESL